MLAAWLVGAAQELRHPLPMPRTPRKSSTCRLLVTALTVCSRAPAAKRVHALRTWPDTGNTRPCGIYVWSCWRPALREAAWPSGRGGLQKSNCHHKLHHFSPKVSLAAARHVRASPSSAHAHQEEERRHPFPQATSRRRRRPPKSKPDASSRTNPTACVGTTKTSPRSTSEAWTALSRLTRPL